ncbi:MAG TPA: outer membrane protein assembly factor BamA [Candidatus Cloacimonadota bacterium]|nr:outer membrane protein assembly factor BamA [Candidatus Cloacimonadota bacterium]
MRIKSSVVLILVFLFSLSCYAQENLILDIKVSGNKHISNELILSSVSLKIGDYIDPVKVTESIKSLYKLNVFDDVSFDEEVMNNGIRILINVIELPVIKSISYKGNKVLSASKLDEIIVLRKGSYWSSANAFENNRKILAEYKSKGFNNASIEYDAQSDENNQVDLKIIFKEGKKVSVRKIIVLGNENLTQKQILKKMKTKAKSLFRSGKFEEEQFEQDQSEIINLYKKMGYMEAQIVNIDQEVKEDRFIDITITIEEGIKYYFGSVQITGNERFTSEALLENITLKENEIFNLEEFNKQLSKISSMYYEDGYIYSEFNPIINKEGSKVNVNLEINENNRAKIHKIHISGNRKTKEKVIRRQLEIAPGDYFKQSFVVKSQQNVYNMGFFEPDMKLDYQPINKEGDIDLYLNVNDKTSGQANGGIGYNSQDKVIGQFSVSHNNILGNNWTGSLKWEFGASVQNIESSFTNPYFYDTKLLLGTNFYHTRKDWDSFNYQIYTNGGGIQIGYPLKFINYSRIVGGYSYYSKKYNIQDWNDSYTSSLAELDSTGWQNTSSISATISRDSRDNVFYPMSGSRVTLYSELAGGIMGGDFNYFKQIAEVSWYTQTFWKLVLRTKWRMGYVTSYGNSSNDVPPDERFYLGGTGADGLRGYGDRSIGPADGGKREILFSTEYTVPISTDQIIGLAFFDAGNSFNKFENFNFLDFKKGSGLGVRIRSPFGLIGFDYAYNFEEKIWEPHFQFGTNF